MSTTSVTLDSAYRDAMREHLGQLAEELLEIKALLSQQGHLSAIAYRAAERNLQLLIEACIGIAKQSLKAQGLQVPSDARKAFSKLNSLGLDSSGADWNRVIGMRNALVHDYLNLEPERIVEVIRNDKYTELLKFAQSILGESSPRT